MEDLIIIALLLCKILYLFMRKKSTKKQVEKETQTTMKFTEKLTNFHTIELSSDETFDKVCNICDMNTVKEVVEYCWHCEQFLCYKCCKHHEKISLSQNHKIIGKDDFNQLKGKSLYGVQLVPLMRAAYPLDQWPVNKRLTTSTINPIFSLGTENYFLLSSSNGVCLGCISETGTFQKIKEDKDGNCKDKDGTGSFSIRYFATFESKEIRFLKYQHDKDCVCFQSAFQVTGECHGVAPFNNGLVVCLHIVTGFSLPEWQIQYLDLQGKIKRQIYYDGYGKPLLKGPAEIASNHKEDIEFVSDRGNNTVIALGLKGEVIYKFDGLNLTNFGSLTCDEEDNVYVASYETVLQIDRQGKKSRVILQNKLPTMCIDKVFYNKDTQT